MRRRLRRRHRRRRPQRVTSRDAIHIQSRRRGAQTRSVTVIITVTSPSIAVIAAAGKDEFITLEHFTKMR